MIAVDTSALMAILLTEPEATACIDALSEADEVVISAPTLTEARIVASGRGVGDAMSRLLERFPLTVATLDVAAAHRASEAHARYGRGQHTAKLNYGDCFAYEVAQRYGCPLLFVGDDFSKTDIKSVL